LNTKLHDYPSTPYLPWAPGNTEGKSKVRGGVDVYLKSADHFRGREVVVTAKMDGENATLYRDDYHARSLDGRHHPSRSWIKGFQAQVGHTIPEGWRVCGENMYAQHSIVYPALPSYYLAFAVFDDANNCLSWDDTVDFCRERGIEMVPVLWRGQWDEKAIQALWPMAPLYGEGESEGYVVRDANTFPYQDYMLHIAKYVRPNHVQTDSHWMHGPVRANGLV
jgi:hypothetical protein